MLAIDVQLMPLRIVAGVYHLAAAYLRTHERGPLRLTTSGGWPRAAEFRVHERNGENDALPPLVLELARTSRS